ncbi:hypothetical protein BJV78DRAFT_1307686 [Lactifluus subvellereus]|nr:hypothetical protein BJV78DRAFT_1307686 [Lactifluus subvellereus]
MDNWPPTIVYNSAQRVNRFKGKSKAIYLPYPLLEGGALTSATLREDGGRFEWVTAQNRTSDRKLVCSKDAVLAFPATRSPQVHSRTSSWLQRAEQGAHFLRTYYPDVDVPAELIREQVGVEAQLEDSLRAFDPLVGDLVASFHVSDDSKRRWSFMAFPMGATGCDLNIKEIGSFDRSNLNGHLGIDAQIHSSLGYAALVNDQGHVFRHTLLRDANLVKAYEGVSDPHGSNDDFWRIALGEHEEICFLMSSKSVQLVDFRTSERGVQVYSVTRAPDLLTSMGCDPDDGLLRLVTTNDLIWVDPRFHIRPILAWKHEREYDRTLSSHGVNIGDTQKRFNTKSRLAIQLPCRFPSEPHAGFYIIHPHQESGNSTAASLLQLTSRGGIYQSALTLCKDHTQSPACIDISWSSAIHRLDAASSIQRPDFGKLGARAVQEVDFRQAYQRLFSPLDATEAVYPPENADAVYQTLDAMLFDIAFRSGEEPIHASRADFLTQRRVPRETLVKRAAWHFNFEPVLQKFVPDTSGDVQLIAERLRKYDLILDDYRSGSSLRRESEAREELAVDLVLSMDVFSAHSFAKPEAEITEDDRFETMSRAAEAMTLSEMGVPSVHFGYLSPVHTTDHHSPLDTTDNESGLTLPLGVRLLLAEWDTGVHPDQYTYHDPYDDQQPPAASPILHTPIRKRGGRDHAQTTQSQRPPPIATAAPPVIARSRTFPISSSQPVTRQTLEAGSLNVTHFARTSDPHPDSQAPMASTQVEPGPFGGRPLITGKKKGAPGRKRVGGF